MDSSLRRGMRDFGGVPVSEPNNTFIMPEGVPYGAGDPVYEAISGHFDVDVWNGLDPEAQLSVVESLEELYPPDEEVPPPVTTTKSALPFGPTKGRPRV